MDQYRLLISILTNLNYTSIMPNQRGAAMEIFKKIIKLLYHLCAWLFIAELAICGFLVCVVYFDLFDKKPSPRQSVESRMEEPEPDYPRLITNQRQFESSETLRASYPLLEGLADKEIQKKINNTIESATDLEKYCGGANDICKVHYEYGEITADIISVKLSGTFQNNSDSAINSFFIGLNFDVKSGELLTLGDILDFKTSGSEITRLVLESIDDGIPEFSGYARESIESQPDLIGNERSFYINKGGPVLLFDMYEIAPRTAGNIEVPIPIYMPKPFVKSILLQETEKASYYPVWSLF